MMADRMFGQSRSSWLLLSVAADRQHGGNEGYDDVPDAYYSWDSTVPNHAAIEVGDKVALWDKHALLGASVIEEITVSEGDKIVYRCSHCGRASIKQRKELSPRFRCYDCGTTFDRPASHIVGITTYRARHDAGWTNLVGMLSGPELRTLCESPTSQLSLRRLNWTAFTSAVDLRRGSAGFDLVEARTGSSAENRFARVTRARPSGVVARRRLMDRHGSACALTGSVPEATLDSADLLSFGALGERQVHDGLLLRRDVLPLLDSGAIAVAPSRLTIDVRKDLTNVASYWHLHGSTIHASLSARQRSWVEMHWNQHR